MREGERREGVAGGRVCWDRSQKAWAGKQNKLQQLRIVGTEPLFEEARVKVTQMQCVRGCEGLAGTRTAALGKDSHR